MADSADLGATGAHWQRRVVDRSLGSAARRSVDRGSVLVAAAAALIERSDGDDFTVQDVADEAGQSLRTLYQHFASKDDLLLAVFEEAMRGYAQLISAATASLDDPLERLAGGLLAALRIPDSVSTTSTRGLMRVRARLTQVQPDAVGRAREPIASALRTLVLDAVEAGRIDGADLDAATFVLLTLNTTSVTTHAVGSDQGAPPPDDLRVVVFCLRGLGVPIDSDWLDSVGRRLRLPHRRLSVVTPFTPRHRSAEETP